MAHQTDHEEIKEGKKIFRKLDEDNDGYISL